MELSEIIDELERIANDKRHTYRDIAREMLETYNTGMASRINGAGEYEEDDEEWAYQGSTAAYASRPRGPNGNAIA